MSPLCHEKDCVSLSFELSHNERTLVLHFKRSHISPTLDLEDKISPHFRCFSVFWCAKCQNSVVKCYVLNLVTEYMRSFTLSKTTSGPLFFRPKAAFPLFWTSADSESRMK